MTILATLYKANDTRFDWVLMGVLAAVLIFMLALTFYPQWHRAITKKFL